MKREIYNEESSGALNAMEPVGKDKPTPPSWMKSSVNSPGIVGAVNRGLANLLGQKEVDVVSFLQYITRRDKSDNW